ncbi:MAG: LPS assembly lipoprotein LptE [Pseudomonadota bacterium]
MSWSRRRFLALSAVPLAGCGFTPLYGEGSAARNLQGRIRVDVLEGRFGFDLRERLVTRLGPPSNPSFNLKVRTTSEQDSRAIRADNTTSRFTLSILAEFQVIERATGAQVFQDTAQAFTAYSAVASAFATREAEADAFNRLATTLADQIVLRLATTAEVWAT